MPRRKTILQATHPYHITARCINQEWFKLDVDQIWTIMSDYLFLLHHGFQFQIHSFVLMNNHFHAILSTPQSNISEGMNYFMREVSRTISNDSKRKNQTFGGPYHWCILDSYYYFLNAYKYVYRNPVEAGITAICEDYSYSSLSRLLGRGHLGFPVYEDTLLFNTTVDMTTLDWLNIGQKEDTFQIKKALKKQYFRFEKQRENGKRIRSDNYVY